MAAEEKTADPVADLSQRVRELDLALGELNHEKENAESLERQHVKACSKLAEAKHKVVLARQRVVVAAGLVKA